MPAQWTADILGEMHISGITAKELAAEVGWNPKYLSAVMNGHRKPKHAERVLWQAVRRIQLKQERRERGLSDNLGDLLMEYRTESPEYAERLGAYLGIMA